MDITHLNAEFGLGAQLEFINGQGGLPMARIRSDHAEALVSIHAGQLLAYRPRDQAEDLLFVSEQAWFQPGKAIKGGAPVCWPWFGPDPQGQGRPAHGFVRSAPWAVLGSALHHDGSVALRLGFANPAGSAPWPLPATLELTLEIGTSVALSLTTTNLADTEMPLSQALHTYFRIGDITQARVHGLDGCRYQDKVAGGEAQQQGELGFTGEVDRIYGGVTWPVEIHDPALARRILIEAQGSASAVVWNPWIDKAREMADFADQEYRQMLCVETANAGPDQRRLAPGERHRLATRYRILAL